MRSFDDDKDLPSSSTEVSSYAWITSWSEGGGDSVPQDVEVSLDTSLHRCYLDVDESVRTGDCDDRGRLGGPPSAGRPRRAYIALYSNVGVQMEHRRRMTPTECQGGTMLPYLGTCRGDQGQAHMTDKISFSLREGGASPPSPITKKIRFKGTSPLGPHLARGDAIPSPLDPLTSQS